MYWTLIQDFARRDYFQEYFGYDCIDEGFVPGVMGKAIPDTSLLDLGREVAWPPLETEVIGWDDDSLFDMIEYLFDRVSRGDAAFGGFHSYSGCGWHYSKFQAEPVRNEYGSRVNMILRRCGMTCQHEQMGHSDGSFQARYSHITPAMVDRLLDGLTKHWLAALDVRRAFHPRSPVAVLDRLLGEAAR